jgi:uncharacterized protein
MVQLAQGFFRKTVFKTIRYFKHPRKLKNSPIRRWFTRHFMDKRVWKPTQHTLAAGASIGSLVMLQMFPGQMFIAAILSAIFRVNIPIAVIVSWITNPFTFVAFGLFQKWLGDLVLPWLPSFMQNAARGTVEWLMANLDRLPTRVKEAIGEDLLAQGAEFITSVYVGGLVGGIALAVVSYPLTWLIWEAFARAAAARKARYAEALVASASGQRGSP